MVQARIDSSIAQAIAPTGALRVALNMGNPIITASQAGGPAPAGVAIDLSREFARQLGVEAVFSQLKTAAESLAAVTGGAADIGFMAIDPGRAGVRFTGAYIEIVGSYVVPEDSPIRRNEDVDQAGNGVVVGDASAYDLFLTRHLSHAHLVRVPLSERVIDGMLEGGHAVAAGIRQQLQDEMKRFTGVRLLDGGFMVIRQAAILPADRGDAAGDAFCAFIEWARSSGFVQDALARHGVEGAQIASKA